MKTPVASFRVHLYSEEEVEAWQEFQHACKKQGLSASQKIREWITQATKK